MELVGGPAAPRGRHRQERDPEDPVRLRGQPEELLHPRQRRPADLPPPGGLVQPGGDRQAPPAAGGGRQPGGWIENSDLFLRILLRSSNGTRPTTHSW